MLDYLSKKKTPHQNVVETDTDTQLDLLVQDTDRTYKIIQEEDYKDMDTLKSDIQKLKKEIQYISSEIETQEGLNEDLDSRTQEFKRSKSVKGQVTASQLKKEENLELSEELSNLQLQFKQKL